MDEQRKYMRKSLHSKVSIFERNTNEYVGLLVDYSQAGFMVACSVQAMGIGGRYEYMLLVQSSEGAESTRLQLDAECVWCDKGSLSFYGVGFRLENISPEARQVLESCAD